MSFTILKAPDQWHKPLQYFNIHETFNNTKRALQMSKQSCINEMDIFIEKCLITEKTENFYALKNNLFTR